MKLLKRENWWVWLLVILLSSGAGIIALGALLDIYEKDHWYTKWYYWVIGILCLFIPFTIMLTVFYIESTAKVAAKLNISGKEIYLSPYIWILGVIIPFIGWLALAIMFLYLEVSILVALYNGEGEKYTK